VHICKVYLFTTRCSHARIALSDPTRPHLEIGKGDWYSVPAPHVERPRVAAQGGLS
jgi:hypothetical protein